MFVSYFLFPRGFEEDWTAGRHFFIMFIIASSIIEKIGCGCILLLDEIVAVAAS